MTKQVLLSNEVYKKLTTIRLASKSKIRGHHKGSHRAQRIGSSMDFSDYRAYHLGDDVRQIDWNVYARSEKYFIKRFLDEQEMRVHIVLDGTKSMNSQPEKWLLAKQLAAALGFIVLQQDDRLQCTYITDTDIPPFRQKGGSAKKHFLHTLQQLPEPSMKISFAEKASEHLVKGQTVLIAITDALEPIEKLELFIRRLRNYAGDIRLIQIVEQDIHHPSFTGDIALFDIETEKTVNVSVTSGTLQNYFERKAQHEKQLDLLCNKYGVAKVQVLVEEGFQHSFFHRLKKANWTL
jgi:uncharacterized protein (DUF58 family)